MPRTWGKCSVHDAVDWTCQRGHKNPAQRHEFFAIPTFICGCHCGEEYPYDFEICLGDIIVNGYKLLGDMPEEGITGDCIQHAFVKQMQITKRAKRILQKKDPNSIPNMSTPDLKSKYEQRVGKVQQDAVTEVVHTALAVKEEGIDSEDSKMVYKACNVSVVRRTEYTQITAYLARGFPLHAGVYVGRTLSGLRFCRKYKPPRLGDFRNAKRTRISCHAILLVGAGRKKGKWYFFFLNTWRRFCLRFDSSGKIITHGIGKVVAGRLYRNLFRLSRFKEESSEMSLQPQDGIEISEHNRQLIAIDQ
ncbi:unnamed protein product [Alopecurus aequalis]